MKYEQQSPNLENVEVSFTNGNVSTEILANARREYAERIMGTNVLPFVVENPEQTEPLAS